MHRLIGSWLAGVLFLVVAAQAKADYLFTTIAVPGSSNTEVYGINNAGEIVGTYSGAGGGGGFLLSHGALTTLTGPGSRAIQPYAINDLGQIVGGFYDVMANRLGFL